MNFGKVMHTGPPNVTKSYIFNFQKSFMAESLKKCTSDLAFADHCVHL